MKFSSLAAPDMVKMRSFGATSDENFNRMTMSSFQFCFYYNKTTMYLEGLGIIMLYARYGSALLTLVGYTDAWWPYGNQATGDRDQSSGLYSLSGKMNNCIALGSLEDMRLDSNIVVLLRNLTCIAPQQHYCGGNCQICNEKGINPYLRFCEIRHLDIEWLYKWKSWDSWWRHQLETNSTVLAICAGNSQVPGEFPAQRPVTRSFDVFFDLRLNKRLSKQSWGWWFETLSCPLWRHCNVTRRQ